MAGTKATEKVKGLFIRSFATNGFRRCGRRFNRDGTFVPLADLKKGEAEILQADKNLVVEEREQEVAAAE